MDEQSFQTPQVEVSSENPPKKSALLPILIGVLFLTVVSVSAFFLVKNQTNQSTVPVPTVVPSFTSILTSPVQDETVNTEGTRSANWKTYTNKELSIEFKYPQNWNEVSSCKFGSICFSSEDFEETINEYGEGGGFYITSRGSLFSVSTTLKTATMKLDDFCHPGGPLIITSCVDTKLSDIDAKKRTEVLQNNVEYATVIGALTNKFLIMIGQYYKAPKDKILLDQILSTFKFLDQTTYTACGCGCCFGVTPIKQCLYHSKGDLIEKIIKEDSIIKQSSQCSVMGCSRGTEYYYCD